MNNKAKDMIAALARQRRDQFISVRDMMLESAEAKKFSERPK